MNARPLALVALLFAAPASAGVTVGADQTFGSGGYRGTKARASIDYDETFYLEPNFTIYRSDASTGTYKDFGLRLGYETGPVAFGVSGSHQPRVDGYRRTTAGADLTFSITPGGSGHGQKMAGPSSGGSDAFGKGIAGIDFGASVLRTWHEDEFTGAPTRRRRALAARTIPIEVQQTDGAVFAGLRLLITELSAEFTKSWYNRDLTTNNFREALALRVTGMDAVVQGFPDTSFNAKLKWKTLPFVRPYLSYTRTTFKLDAPVSSGYEVGATAGFDLVTLKAAYERYVQSGYPDQSFVTVGASLNF